MSNHIDHMTVEVTGIAPELYVQSFELNLALNDIPSITLNVLPITPPTPGDGRYITASSPTIEDITKLYSELMAKSLDLKTTATIWIDLDALENPDGVAVSSHRWYQSVTLKDWILTDVGLSSVSNQAAPMLAVVFHHPAVKLDRTGSIYEEVENKGDLTEVFRYLSGGDLISYMDSVYKAYAAGGSILFHDIAPRSLGGPIAEDRVKVKKFRARLAEYCPGQFIEDKTGKMFLMNVAPEFADNIRITAGYYSRPQGFCESTWARLVQDLCPMFLTQIRPCYDKPKLELHPFSPWAKPSLTIMTDVVETLDVVSTDPAPILGTAVTKDADTSEYVVDSDTRTQEDTEDDAGDLDYTHAFYFPRKKAAKAGDMGEIFNIGEARVISTIVDIDETSNATVGNDGPDGDNLEDAGNGVSDEDRAKMDETYARAMFLINYRKNCKASVTTVPLFKDSEHNMLYPGKVLTVCDRDKDGHTTYLFNGYITQMVISCSKDGHGATYISMSHARPTDPESVLVDEGEENPCYPPAS